MVSERGPELVVPTVEDAGRIAAVINARASALGGATEESAEGVARWFAMPFIDPAEDMRLALDDSGTAVGYADVSGPEDGTPKAWIDLRALTGSGAALELLFTWAQQRGAERAGSAGKLQFFADERAGELRELLTGAGYVVVRSSFEMECSLEGVLKPPVWPAGVDLRPFDERDGEAVHTATEEAFRDHWGYVPTTFEAWCAQNLGDGEDSSLWRVAWDRGEIAGACINRPRRGEDESVGWVGVLAVRRPWRRRGLGEALLRDSFALFAARGKRSAGLGVDAENTTGAVALYERVGMHVVRRSDTWERTA
jgi:ribosomal protein S18 acetylase RimI-like enzyme